MYIHSYKNSFEIQKGGEEEEEEEPRIASMYIDTGRRI
jgi:hypothetical protein